MTEITAYEQFAKRIAAVGTTGPASRTLAADMVSSVDSSTSAKPFREAFRDTVMSVSHYEDEYDEPLNVHVGSELSPELACGLRADDPPPGFDSALSAATNTAIENRRELLDDLKREAGSLTTARSSLETIVDELRVGNRDATASELSKSAPDTLECRLQAVLDDRQTLIQNRTLPANHDGHDFCAYLYGDLADWTYPVLFTVASLQQDIRAVDDSQ